MYVISFKNIRGRYFFGGTFFLMGLFFLVIFGWYMFNGMIKKTMMDSSVQAIKIDPNESRNSNGNYQYSPIYYYKVNGITYSCNINYFSNLRVLETQKMVYYNSKKPQECVTDYTTKPNIYMYFVCLFPLIFVIVGILKMKATYLRIKKLKLLARNGILVKNIEYTLEPTNCYINDSLLYAIAVDYKFPNGEIRHLVGEPRKDYRSLEQNGVVDLLIDPKDETNYYLDFNIKRK